MAPGIAALLALLPLAATLAAIAAGLGPIAGSAVGIALAVGLVAVTDFALPVAALPGAAATVAILTLSVALVVVAGQYLNAVLRARGIVAGLADRIGAVPIDREKKALVLLLGIAPAVESLTGFGVSLFLTVPLVFHLYRGDPAWRLSLISMNIMPWGTVGLATLIGAKLAAVEAETLGVWTAVVSAPVFPLLGLIGAAVLGGTAGLRRDGWYGVVLGCALAGLLWLNNRFLFVETAGIFAGLGTALLGVVLARRRPIEAGTVPPAAGDRPGAVALVAPYLLLVGLIVASRAIEPLWRWLGEAIVLESGAIRFSVLTSPGLMLALTALAVQAQRPVPAPVLPVLHRASKPVLSIFAFLVLAQVMREAGMIAAVAGAMRGLGPGVLAVAAPAIGMASGLATGSNLGANALAMPVLAEVGAAAGAPAFWAAVQNSAAGHAVFASVPIAVLVASIAREAGVDSDPATFRRLVRFGLVVAASIGAVLVGWAAILAAWAG
jgi:lactate permease